jgi:hypothetical protein
MEIVDVHKKIHPNKAIFFFHFRNIGQFFDETDRRPLPDRELSDLAEDMLSGYADEFAVRRPLEFVIVFPDNEISPGKEGPVIEAIRRHFSRRVPNLEHDLKLIRREGFYSLFLMIGTIITAVIFVCLTLDIIILLPTMSPDDAFPNIVAFAIAALLITIANWVTFWATIELFLYDYRNLHRKMRIYKKITRTPIRVAAESQEEAVSPVP